MGLTDFVIQYLAHEKFERIYQSEDYQKAWEQENMAENELVGALTKKQRRLFHAYKKQRDAMLAVELSRLLEGYTMIISGDFELR